MKILTMCRAGLVRSVALADVLKLHFEPADVLPAGMDFNTEETKEMLFKWADIIVVMEEHYLNRIPADYRKKALVCEVGPDTYGTPKDSGLIALCWEWVRRNKSKLYLEEHFKKL